MPCEPDVLRTSPLSPRDPVSAFLSKIGPAPMLVWWAGRLQQQLGEGGLGEPWATRLDSLAAVFEFGRILTSPGEGTFTVVGKEEEAG